MMQPEHDRTGPVQRDAVATRNQYARTIYLYTCAPAGHERPIPGISDERADFLHACLRNREGNESSNRNFTFDLNFLTFMDFSSRI